mmetsp:Transcript_24249/g.75456  ORF Transcript_24249/g.75456 Transcript_24249/m.75456 type:complete len:99 (+) Transcript_24249:415-711(+)
MGELVLESDVQLRGLVSRAPVPSPFSASPSYGNDVGGFFRLRSKLLPKVRFTDRVSGVRTSTFPSSRKWLKLALRERVNALAAGKCPPWGDDLAPAPR